jgi:hypothetical protein
VSPEAVTVARMTDAQPDPLDPGVKEAAMRRASEAIYRRNLQFIRKTLAAEPLVRRAAFCWYEAEHRRRNGFRIPVPSPASHIWTSRAGRRYVVLENADGMLACYRARNDGALRILTRWPRWLDMTEPEETVSR